MMKTRIPDQRSAMERSQFDPRHRGFLAVTTTVALVIAAWVGRRVEGPATAQTGSAENTRYVRGLEALRAVGGPDYDRTVRALDPISPDMSRLNIEGPYGDVMSRPGLDLKSRELVNVAAITALANARPALKYHIAGMLNTGWSPGEIVETVLHSTVYAGFPATQYGMQAVREVFRERDVGYRPKSARPEGDDWQLGIKNLRATGGDMVGQTAGAFAEVAPDLARLTVEFAHGEIWNRPGLSLKDRELATLAMVIANGNQDTSIRYHVEACLRAGWTRVQLTEVLIQMTVYIGWPQAQTAIGPALEVFQRVEREGMAPASDRTGGLANRRQAEDDRTRYARGFEALGRISQASGEAVVNSFNDIAPDLGRYIVEFSYGDVFARPNLDLKTRELATVAALTAKGTAADAGPLKVHVHAALNVGANRQEVVEAIVHMLPYAGFVSVQQAMTLAAEVFAERGLTGGAGK
jgi:4-carboxymuconolactone decarboxylase